MVLKVMFHDVGFTADNSSGSTIRSRTALKFSERFRNFRRCQDLFNSVKISELRVGVVNTVSMVLLSNFSEVLKLSSILFHVFFTSITKHLRGHRSFSESTDLNVLKNKTLERISSVIEESFKRASEHFFKTKSKNTVSLSSRHSLVSKVKSSTSSRAVVVYIYNRDSSHANLVYSALSTGGISINVTSEGGFNLIVLDIGISHSTVDSDLT